MKVTKKQAREQHSLVEKHAALARAIAFDFYAGPVQAHFAIDELISFAMLGLHDASRRYDAENSAKASFATFARHRIKGSIRDGIRRADVVGRQVRSNLSKLDAARDVLIAQLGREPERAEIVAQTDLTARQQRSIDMLMTAPVPLDPIFDKVANTIVDPTLESPEKLAMRSELHARLRSVITKLSKREQAIVTMYYEKALTMREIGAELDMHESRVCQLNKQLLSNLKTLLAAQSIDSNDVRAAA